MPAPSRRRSLVATAALVLLAAPMVVACSEDPAKVGEAGADPVTSMPVAVGGAPNDPAGGIAFAGAVQTVLAEEALVLLEQRPEAVVIDVRTPEEFAEGHVPGARLLDLSGGQFEAEMGSLDPNGVYLLYCRSGNRSAQAAQLMGEAGFTEVYDMGALADWQAAGGEVATG